MATHPATAQEPSSSLPAFEDGLGKRYHPAVPGEYDAPLEVLCFRQELTSVPSFEFALRERVGHLASFQHPYYARVRKVERLSDRGGTLALVSECTHGVRLAEMLVTAEQRRVALDIDAGLCLVRQLAAALALLHDSTRVAHGAIGPERLVITPQARLFIPEFVLGPALEQLRYSRERYWKDLRVALPHSVGLARFDDRVDITQLGLVALTLILGRPLHEQEYPGALDDLVASATERWVDGDRQPLTPALRSWVRRALQLDGQSSFRSLQEAKSALERMLAEESCYMADIGALEGFLGRYHDSKPVASAARPMPELPATPSRVPIAVNTPSGDPVHDVEEFKAVEPVTARPRVTPPGRMRWIAAVVVLAAVAGGAFATRHYFWSAAAPAASGTLAVDTNPAGAQVFVDGTARGLTPLTLSLPPGPHTLIVQGSGDSRAIPVTISQGAVSSQYLEFRQLPSTAVGQLQIVTEPNGARATVDGVPQGVTPMIVADLSPGEHLVTLESEMGSMNHKVVIEAGITSSLVVPLRSSSTSGWLSVSSPVQMELYERGRLLGNSGIDRIMLETGRHEIEVVNETLGFRVTRTVHVTPARVSPMVIELPKGVISLNAVPWATVSIDGEHVGDTPIGNLSLPIGWHEVVFRNPQLGEQRRAVAVTLHAPARLSIDLTAK
jgi:hypothetical protein